MSLAGSINRAGIAVITGAASGIGFEAARRCVLSGMRTALLDVSAEELATAERELRALAPDPGHVLAVRCNVAVPAECEAARAAVGAAFPNSWIAFLFNNAGISGNQTTTVLKGDMADWRQLFNVNVFGAVNVLRAFVPMMVAAGPAPSGQKACVVTTSSSVGLFSSLPIAYGVSKMATTALAEHFSIELEELGERAAHISAHSLHPSVVGTAFHRKRQEDGTMTAKAGFQKALAMVGSLTAVQVVDGLFSGLDAGKYYITVDCDADVPTAKQVAQRMEDQIHGSKPRKAAQFGVIKKLIAKM